MMENKNRGLDVNRLVIANSPLSGRIYAGIPLKDGVWGARKKDITNDCIFAVVEFLRQEGPQEVVLNDRVFHLKIEMVGE